MPVSERGVVGHNASGELRLSLEIFVVQEEIAVNERLRRSDLVDRICWLAARHHSSEDRARLDCRSRPAVESRVWELVRRPSTDS